MGFIEESFWTASLALLGSFPRADMVGSRPHYLRCYKLGRRSRLRQSMVSFPNRLSRNDYRLPPTNANLLPNLLRHLERQTPPPSLQTHARLRRPPPILRLRMPAHPVRPPPPPRRSHPHHQPRRRPGPLCQPRTLRRPRRSRHHRPRTPLHQT